MSKCKIEKMKTGMGRSPLATTICGKTIIEQKLSTIYLKATILQEDVTCEKCLMALARKETLKGISEARIKAQAEFDSCFGKGGE